MKNLITILSVILFSCANNFHLFKQKDINTRIAERNLPQKLEEYKPDSIFLVGNLLKKEKKIMQYSNLFIYSNDSINKPKLVIEPLKRRRYWCGTPITLTFLTFGLLPGYLPEQYDYEFMKINNLDTSIYRISIDGFVSISIWNWLLKPFRNEDKIIANRLREKYVNGEITWKKQWWINEYKSIRKYRL
jgi:hypothetical protein